MNLVVANTFKLNINTNLTTPKENVMIWKDNGLFAVTLEVN